MMTATAAETKRHIRQSNLELLRLLAMFCIVANHLVGQGDVLRDAVGLNYIFSFFMSQAARISVNIFLIIGCWFMVDAPFRGIRFVRLWLEELFYTVTLTLLMACFYPADVKPKYIFASFFPVFGYNHWFISGYLVLILMSPFLKQIFRMERKYMKRLVILLLLFCSVWSSVRPFENETLDTIVWFSCIFVFVGYFKTSGRMNRAAEERRKSFLPWLALAASLAGYLLLCLITLLPRLGNYSELLYTVSLWTDQYLQDYKALPNLLIAAGVFIFFLRLRIGEIKLINFFSTSTLAVYIVHQVPVFTLFLWKELVRVQDHLAQDSWPVYMIGAILYIFLTITLIDKLRAAFLEKWILRTGPVQKVCRKLEEFYGSLL